MKKHLLWLLFIVACGPSQEPVVTPELQIVRGNDQSAKVGNELPTAIEALLRDKDSGTPLPGRIVNWVVIGGGGTVFAGATETSTTGVAAQRWTLGGSLGEQRLVARWVDPETGLPITIDTAKAIATPGAAEMFDAHFGIAGNEFRVNDTIEVEYRFLDHYRNETTVCSDGGSIDRVAWTSSDSAAILPLNTVAIKNGIHAARFLAVASRTVPVVLTGLPAACAPNAPSVGVSGWVH